MNIITDIRARIEPFKMHLLAVAVMGLVGIAVGVWKATNEPDDVQRADRWFLPQWSPFKADALRREFSANHIFTPDPNRKAEDKVDVEQAVAPWRFMGTMLEGEKRVALIQVEKERGVRRILPGDKLPGGAEVTAVRTGDLVFREEAGEKIVSLFSKDGGATAVNGQRRK